MPSEARRRSRTVEAEFDADAERSEEEKSDDQAEFDADAERSEEEKSDDQAERR